MAEVYGLTDSEIAFLKALTKHGVPFMIVGLSAAVMQGAHLVTQDIDLWFKRLEDPALRAALKETGVAYVSPSIDQPPMFAGRNMGFDIVMTMSGLGEFDEEIKNTIPLSIGEITVPVLGLERIILSKKTAGRPKDKLSLPVLEDALLARRREHEIRNESFKKETSR